MHLLCQECKKKISKNLPLDKVQVKGVLLCYECAGEEDPGEDQVQESSDPKEGKIPIAPGLWIGEDHLQYILYRETSGGGITPLWYMPTLPELLMLVVQRRHKLKLATGDVKTLQGAVEAMRESEGELVDTLFRLCIEAGLPINEKKYPIRFQRKAKKKA